MAGVPADARFARSSRAAVGASSGPVFLGGTTFKSIAVEGNFGFGHWNGTNDFIYTGNAPYDRQGLNSWQGATPQTMTTTLQAQFAQEGTVMRIVIDPGPLNLGLQNSQAQFNTLMGQIQAALTLNTNAGIRSIVDLSVRPITSVQATGFGLADTEIINAAPSGTFFTNYVNTVSAVAQWLAANDDEHWVALETFNEPPTASVDWTTVALPPIWSAARAGWPKGTIFIAGDGGATAPGLAKLNPANFDANTCYVWHSYDPFDVVFQSQAGAPVDMAYVSAMEWPPNASNKATVISNATTAINSDGSLTSGQKTAAITAMTNAINAYYSAPRDAAWVEALWKVATDWADANSVARNRLWMGENSINGASAFNYLSLSGASDATVATYLAHTTSWSASHGTNQGYFDLEDSPGGGNGFSIIRPYGGSWDNNKLTALGLRNQ